MSDQIKAPFTPEQVAALQFYQDSGVFHPFTCGNRENHPPEMYRLTPTVRGWICQFCDYTQDWAHSMMADRAAIEGQLEARRALFAGPHDHQ